jgi:hypothetical protein
VDQHSFESIVSACANTLADGILETETRLLQELETSAATRLIVGLKMMQHQRVIVSVGVFSIFDAHLQDALECEDGFACAERQLLERGQTQLHEQFLHFRKAINVLKHGQGASYRRLLKDVGKLPFELSREDDQEVEGVVNDIGGYIIVDDRFIRDCARIAVEVCRALDCAA